MRNKPITFLTSWLPSPSSLLNLPIVRFNTSKCKLLTVTRKKTPITFDYTLDGTALTSVSEEILASPITSTLSWDSHIHTITAKANKLLGLLKRACPLLTVVSIRRSLYLSLLKSQLCYATQVWSPAYVTLNAKLEQVQRDVQAGGFYARAETIRRTKSY